MCFTTGAPIWLFIIIIISHYLNHAVVHVDRPSVMLNMDGTCTGRAAGVEALVVIPCQAACAEVHKDGGYWLNVVTFSICCKTT